MVLYFPLPCTLHVYTGLENLHIVSPSFLCGQEEGVVVG